MAPPVRGVPVPVHRVRVPLEGVRTPCPRARASVDAGRAPFDAHRVPGRGVRMPWEDRGVPGARRRVDMDVPRVSVERSRTHVANRTRAIYFQAQTVEKWRIRVKKTENEFAGSRGGCESRRMFIHSLKQIGFAALVLMGGLSGRAFGQSAVTNTGILFGVDFNLMTLNTRQMLV